MSITRSSFLIQAHSPVLISTSVLLLIWVLNDKIYDTQHFFLRFQAGIFYDFFVRVFYVMKTQSFDTNECDNSQMCNNLDYALGGEKYECSCKTGFIDNPNDADGELACMLSCKEMFDFSKPSVFLPLRSWKAGRFEKMFAFGTTHPIVRRDSRVCRAPPQHTSPRFSKSSWYYYQKFWPDFEIFLQHSVAFLSGRRKICVIRWPWWKW